MQHAVVVCFDTSRPSRVCNGFGVRLSRAAAYLRFRVDLHVRWGRSRTPRSNILRCERRASPSTASFLVPVTSLAAAGTAAHLAAMSRHARIEEVSDSDSDPEVMDPSSFDPAQFSRSAIIPATAAASMLGDPSGIPSSAPKTGFISHADSDKYKGYQCLYPLYFDKRRSRAQGRRVGKELAVENPLARDIVDAAQELGMDVVFEPAKMHPKDWANPGRVRVLIKQDGIAVNSRVKNSECYKAITDFPSFAKFCYTLDIVQSVL
jgi:signal recognition particle subunit SEC65